MAMHASMQNSAPEITDFTPFEKMRGEYESMGIYPKGHLMEFARPNLPGDVLTCAAAESAPAGKRVRGAGWPISRQHPKGRGGAVFITIEDEIGDMQRFVRPDVYERCRAALDTQIILIYGEVVHWDNAPILKVQNASPIPLSQHYL